ncbi:glycosyltransferase family 2 protein [Xanthomonadaceae bacterium JHOS43]|nr:glycosyltransferase family 2 protein [Xanthomonadaceae bacterium JHOS43]MCX7562648.1 glycosyltransferase family 2 protein [Xanthomonadaceae bacterium XH05]
MSQAFDVTAIVVSHDSGEYLRACIADLLAQDMPVRVVVVDNASRDGAPDRLPNAPGLEILRNAGNPGFGAACNQGAARSRAAYLLFVNPDCRLPSDTVSRLCRHLEANPDIGLLGAALQNPDGSPQCAARRRTPSPGRAIAQSLGLRSRDCEAGRLAGPGLIDVEATSGALMLIPRELFERLGGFDTGYILHCEDLDLCRRVLQAGQRIAVATDVPVIHHKGTSSRGRPIWVEWQKHRGMWRYFRKFDAATSPFWLRGIVVAGLMGRFPLAALRAWWRR